MDRAKRILYAVVGCIYLLGSLGFAVAYAMTIWINTSLAIQMRMRSDQPSFILPLVILIWFVTGTILLMASIFRSRWLARPQWAVIPLASSSALVALSFLPWLFAPPYQYGYYPIIGICCIGLLAHDIWTCIHRARRLKLLSGRPT